MPGYAKNFAMSKSGNRSKFSASASAKSAFRRSADDPPAAPAFAELWYGKIVLLAASVAAFTLAFAPVGAFYLAWIGLVPWLIVVARHRTTVGAFLWSWGAGIAFFSINMGWLWSISPPGTIALHLYLGLYWAVAAVVIRSTGLLRPIRSPGNAGGLAAALAIAVVWTGLEWVRGTFMTGLPWLFLGHTQTPFLLICQIADVAGVYAVTFVLAMVNATLALGWIRGRSARRIGGTLSVSIALVGGALIYGAVRMSPPVSQPGPEVIVIQPNYPQRNTGEKGETLDERLAFHLTTSSRAIARTPDADLVVWSETLMPELNREFRAFVPTYTAVHQRLANLASRHKVGLLVGAAYGLVEEVGGKLRQSERRNSAYLYDRSGLMAENRYDKIHLVPFGEFIPFRKTAPPLYRFFNLFNPYGYDYTLVPGEALTVFTLQPSSGSTTGPSKPWRFVTPICFEDSDASLVARMFRPEAPGKPKRADFIVNLTNDGWFSGPQMSQHLQLATFRSIENRVPTARSVNTGISGFIDSAGCPHALLATGIEGFSAHRLMLDPRITWYTRIGDLFAVICAMLTAAIAIVGGWLSFARRKAAVIGGVLR